MTEPNAYLRCETKPSRPGLGLWKYSLAILLCASAAIDALWLVPAREAAERTPAAATSSAYREAVRLRCRADVLRREIRDDTAELHAIEAALGGELTR